MPVVLPVLSPLRFWKNPPALAAGLFLLFAGSFVQAPSKQRYRQILPCARGCRAAAAPASQRARMRTATRRRTAQHAPTLRRLWSLGSHRRMTMQLRRPPLARPPRHRAVRRASPNAVSTGASSRHGTKGCVPSSSYPAGGLRRTCKETSLASRGLLRTAMAVAVVAVGMTAQLHMHGARDNGQTLAPQSERAVLPRGSTAITPSLMWTSLIRSSSAELGGRTLVAQPATRSSRRPLFPSIRTC